MEVRESGVTVVRSDAPSEYLIAPRTENSVPVGNPTPPATELGKKKRGRPRKYLPDGSLNPAVSPKPISSSVTPPVIDFSAAKRGKARPASSVSKTKYEMENIEASPAYSILLTGEEDEFYPVKVYGERVECSAGASFTPHIVTVNSGEDVTTKILSFSQHGPRTICILSANGAISSVTLRQLDSSGGTLTYEGRFEILSLSGSFTPNDTGETRSRAGGMSVSLASPDGRVVGGGIAGLLVAASPVQVVVGSFLSGNQHEQKPKKQKHDLASYSWPAAALPVSGDNSKPDFSNSDKWPLPLPHSRSKPTDINISLPGERV